MLCLYVENCYWAPNTRFYGVNHVLVVYSFSTIKFKERGQLFLAIFEIPTAIRF